MGHSSRPRRCRHVLLAHTVVFWFKDKKRRKRIGRVSALLFSAANTLGTARQGRKSLDESAVYEFLFRCIALMTFCIDR
jgi:hypothetical protein